MNEFSQASELAQKSQNILISLPQEISEDGFCGALALFYTLKELDKKVNLTLPSCPERLKFLMDDEILQNSNQGNVVISINTRRGKIDKIHYEKDSQELKFYLNLSNGGIELENVSFKSENEDQNLTISISDEGLEFKQGEGSSQEVIIKNSLGGISGMIKEFLQTFGENLVNGRIATYLLAGLISYSQNSQNLGMDSEFLKESVSLIKKGADYQEIIKNFYKTGSPEELKLLGQVFSKLNFKKEIAWSLLSRQDFEAANSSSKNLSFVLKALKLSFLLPKTLFILWESHLSQPIIKGIFYSTKKELVKKILENYEAVTKGNGVLFLARDNSSRETEAKLLELASC
jgi:hypothetical protein